MIEVLKQALEALKRATNYDPVIARAITAIKKALVQPEQILPSVYSNTHQPEQEPVAIKRMKEWIEYLKRKSDFGQHMKIPSEMNAGTCWELAIELEQFINTTPPQRTWQGLTKEQLATTDWSADFRAGALWAEAKLKERNS